MVLEQLQGGVEVRPEQAVVVVADQQQVVGLPVDSTPDVPESPIVDRLES